MSWRNVSLMFRREVLDQLRDRRTLFMVAVLPMLLYPLLGVGTARMTALFTEQPRTVVILGANDLPLPPLLDGRQIATNWFRSAAEAEKLHVISDLTQLPEGVQRSPAEESLLATAKLLSQSIARRQKLEKELATAKLQDMPVETMALQASLDQLNKELNTQFDRSQIQVLIIIPPEFDQAVERRQAELVGRVTSRDALEDEQLHSDARPLIVENSADEKSAIASRRIRDVLRAWERSILAEQLRQSRLPATLTTPINVAEIDLAEAHQVSANIWSKVFPALLVLMTLTGAFHPAIDLCAGEKERGTMETLLICPATRTEIVVGKFLTVMLFSVATAILNLISVGITGKYMTSLALEGASSRLGDLSMPPVSSLVWVVVILIPLATLFSALCLGIATYARSSKEGQYFLTPLLMVTLGLMVFCLSPGIEMHPFYSVMPVIGPGLLLKGLLKANGPDAEMYLYAIPVLGTSVCYSLLALWWAIELFGSESVLFCEAEQFNLRQWFRHLVRNRGPLPTFAAAGCCFLLIVLLQFASWKPMQTAIRNTPQSDQVMFQIELLMIQQVLTIAAPAVLMGIFLTTNVRKTLSLRWPRPSKIVLAALLPVVLHPLVIEMMNHVQWFFPPTPPQVAELMNDLMKANLWVVMIAVAVIPAICEEIAFRGFLLSGFLRHGNVTLAVLLSSFAFGIIHMIPQQVFNAMLLGILLGTICVRTQSLWPGVIFHFVHNLLAVLHGRFGGEVPVNDSWSYFFFRQEGSLRYQPMLLGLASLLGIGLGGLLLRRNEALSFEMNTRKEVQKPILTDL